MLLIILGASLLIFGAGYVHHVKIRLPKRREAREMDRIQRERNDRNTAFLERLMQNENNPPPASRKNSGKHAKGRDNLKPSDLFLILLFHIILCI